MAHAEPVATHPIAPRKVAFAFEEVPRHWFAGNAFATGIANAVNLLFPAGERFFVRAVQHYASRFADDPEMAAQIRGFMGQESTHARAHERYFETLEKQGYQFRDFLRFYEWFSYELIEKYAPPALRLSATAAAEHYTATMANGILTMDHSALMHPAMQRLLLWHAAEEIEHKAVAFDVLQRVAPSYGLRVAGMVISTAMLGGFWLAGASLLLKQDGVTLASGLRSLKELGGSAGSSAAAKDLANRRIVRDVFVAGFLEYIKPGFHPWHHDNREIAERFLERVTQA